MAIGVSNPIDTFLPLSKISRGVHQSGEHQAKWIETGASSATVSSCSERWLSQGRANCSKAGLHPLAHNLLEGAATLALVGFCPVLASVAVLAIKADSFSRSVNNKSLFTALNVAIGTPTISPPGIPLAKTP